MIILSTRSQNQTHFVATAKTHFSLPWNQLRCLAALILGLSFAEHRVMSQNPSLPESGSGHPNLSSMAKLPSNIEVRRIIYGSCIKQDRPMPIFTKMLDMEPDLALLIGDNIYGDSDDLSVLRAKYDALRSNPRYHAFERRIPILATWDDHDFGLNDGGADFSQRRGSQMEFLRFWKVPKDSKRWQQSGIYHAECLGPVNRRLQIIMLDTRYFRSPLKKGLKRRVAGPYVADEDPQKTMLGEMQWSWLEQQLLQPADVRLLVSSIQCIPEAAGQETWSNLPHERRRLLELLRSTDAKGVVLLSGDRHWAELSVLESELDYPLYELTSSSLNQKHPRGTPSENRFRAVPRTFHQENFGVVHIDWDTPNPRVTLEIRDLNGKVQLSHQVQL